MQRVSVISSALASVGYDELTKTLEVLFHSGHVYQYFGVPYHIYASLIGAPSKGKFFHQFVRLEMFFDKLV